MDTGNSNLIFAPLARVSTDAQKKKGESLLVQKKQIEHAIDYLGGEIYKWFSGSEHATPDQERKILDELIREVIERPRENFNAVMVADVSRWSRDNLKNAEYLKILRDNNIRFFILADEKDLHNETDELILTMGVAINQYIVKANCRKSTLSRIERAKQNRPSNGRRPFGRIFHKETGKWSVDNEKKRIVEEMARLYLEDDISFLQLEEKYGMNHKNIHKILTERCGTEWFICYKALKGERIPLEIPELLSESMIQRIRAKCEARRTWDHASQKYKYLLSRIIYDMETGHALTGTPNAKGKRYYRTYRGCSNRYMINADVLEEAVLYVFFNVLANDGALYDAIFDGKQINEVVENWKKDIQTCEQEIKSIEKKISNAKAAILNFGLTGDADIKRFLDGLAPDIKRFEEERASVEGRKRDLENQLQALPTENEIQKKIDSARELIKLHLLQRTQEGIYNSGVLFMKLPFMEKQKLMKMIFGGKDNHGKKYGIYVKPKWAGRHRTYIFEAYGRLGNIYGSVEIRRDGYFPEPDWDITKDNNSTTINGIVDLITQNNPVFFDRYRKTHNKEHIFSERHAHNGFRLHQR